MTDRADDPGEWSVTKMSTIGTLDALTALVEQHESLFVRWSRGPEADASGMSRDDLTGTRMPGLSANPLAAEQWWGQRPLRLWVARRLYDYSHLKHDKGPGVRPWVLQGEELGRGPDNEPLVRCRRPVAWIGDNVLTESERVVASQSGGWGPLRRPEDV